jgi:8-oxo-dGTP pyrophosphatase MutT (NUDIX family)
MGARAVKPRTQLAAGGLVWRGEGDRPTLAVVHRPRGDWVLPKGGVERGESLEDTAHREVQEETCVDADLGAFADTIHFEHDGVLEIVAFWHMRARAVHDFKPNEEIDDLKWLTPPAAVRRLSYKRERALVRDATRMSKKRPWIKRWWTGTWSPSRERLRTVLPASAHELTSRSHATSRTDGIDVQRAIEVALEETEAALERGDAEAGWLCLKLAERLRLLDANDRELKAHATALRNEGVEKLSSWRGKTVADLIPKWELPRPDRQICLYEATRIRDEGGDNDYRRLALLRRNRTLLLPVIVLAIGALVILVWTGVSELAADSESRDAGFLAAVTVVGIIGASISAMQSLGATAKRRMPEALSSATMTLARPVVGAGAALGAYIIAEAGFLQLETESGYVLLALGFAAGFSERFIVRLVDTSTKI